MKKLLLLALLGLGLGGGVWKAQNPDGTLDDLKAQAIASGERLSAGVNAVVQHPENLTKEITLEERIDSLEQQVVASDSDKRTAEIQALLDETLAENANSLSSLQESLNDRVAPMEDMTVAVAELDSALQDTRARTDASNVRIDAIDRRLELLVRRLDEQTTDDDLQSVQDNLESMRTSVDTLKNDLQNSQVQFVEKLADITEQSSSLGLRLNTLASSANTAAVSARDNDESASVQALSSSIDERLSAIEQRLSTVNSDSRRIATLMEQLETANTKIAELEKQDAQANLSLDELGTSVAALTTVGESLSIDSIQTQIKDQLALAQSQFDSSATSSNTVELEALLETTRNRIQTLEQRVQSLPATSSEADDAMETQSALQAQIAELGQRLEELTNSDPALESTVNDVKKQVERLSAEGFVTQDDLRANLESESESIEYKIYFDRNSAEVTEDAARVLNSFIAQEKNRTTGVSIFGFTDRSGSAAYNQQLALQRATNVRSYLIQNGLDFTKVKALSGLGEDAAAAVLPDNADDAQQRVVVLYAAQP